MSTLKNYNRASTMLKRVRCGLVLCIMLAIAYGPYSRIVENQKDLSRSLVKTA